MKQNVTIELFSLVNDPFAFGNEEGRAVNQKMAKIIDEKPRQNIL